MSADPVCGPVHQRGLHRCGCRLYWHLCGEGWRDRVPLTATSPYLAIASKDYSAKKDEVVFDVHAVDKTGNECIKTKTANTEDKESMTVSGYNYEVLDLYTGRDTDINLKDTDYKVYLDQYGYMIGLDVIEAVKNYVFITGIDGDSSKLGARNYKAGDIFLDGTMKTITYNSAKGNPPSYDENIGTNHDNAGLVNTWCTYTVDKDGIYTLNAAAPAIDTNADNDYDAGVDNKVAQYWDKNTAKIDKKNIDLFGHNSAGSTWYEVYGNGESYNAAADEWTRTCNVIINGVEVELKGSRLQPVRAGHHKTLQLEHRDLQWEE